MALTHIIAALHACAGGVEFVAEAPRGKLPASKRLNHHLGYFHLQVAGAEPAPRKLKTALHARAAMALLLLTVF